MKSVAVQFRCWLAFWMLFCCSAKADKIVFPVTSIELLHQRSSVMDCENNMLQILWASHTWSMDMADQVPQSLSLLTNELVLPKFLYCPAVFRESIPTNWDEVDWNHLDYTWLPPQNWNDPTNIVCICRAHNVVGWGDGSLHGTGFKPGWPLLTAAPSYVDATPGETALLELAVAPDTLQPVIYQWRSLLLSYATNGAQVENPDDPSHPFWRTNITTLFTGTNLPGETGPSLLLTNLTINAPEFYSVLISNALGVAQSHVTQIRVRTNLAAFTRDFGPVDLVCLNNLREIQRCAWAGDVTGSGSIPPSLSQMTNQWGQPIFGWPLTLYCPADTNHPPPASWNDVNFDQTSYALGTETNTLNGAAVFCRCKVHGYYLTLDSTLMVRPLMSGITKGSNNTVQVNFRPFAGRTNILEYTEDWLNWSVAGSYGPAANDTQFIEPATAARQRFYRLRLN